MKIEVVCFTGDSGLTDYAVSLCRSLARLGVVSLVTATSLPGRFNGLGFDVHRLFRRSRHYPLDIWRFLAHVLRTRPDWLIFQGPLKFAFVDALLVRCLRLAGHRLAITVHDVLPHYPTRWSRWAFAFYYRSFDRVIAHSHAARQALAAMGVKGEVLVVPHGIYDIFRLQEMDRQTARAQLGGFEPGDFAVLFFGHLEPRKGLLPYLEAARMMTDVPGVRFMLAGANDMARHGPDHAAALEQARSLPHVLLHDRRIPFEEVERYFAACDVVALPYLEGTTSGVLKLALAFTRPVVATRVGDFPEQLPPGGGILIEAGDNLAAHFVAALEEIRQAPDSYTEAMRAGAANAQWPDIAASVLAHLQGNRA